MKFTVFILAFACIMVSCLVADAGKSVEHSEEHTGGGGGGHGGGGFGFGMGGGGGGGGHGESHSSHSHRYDDDW